MASKKTGAGEEFQSQLDKMFKPDEGAPENNPDAVNIDRDLIDPNPFNPREFFPVAELQELGASMRTVGQLQDLVVRPHPTKPGRFEAAIGEKRWRSCAPEFDGNLGAFPKLRALIRPLSNYEMLQVAIEENEKRSDVSAIARARGYQRLL